VAVAVLAHVEGRRVTEDDFEHLYATHVVSARRLAYLVTGDSSAAEDIAQEAFVRVFGRLRAVRDPAALPAYLRRAVVNVALSRGRSRQRETRRIERLGPPPEYTELVADRDGAVWAAVQRLPDRQRAAIVLRYWLDLSEADAAATLGCRPGTIKSLASRAIAALRQELADERD
jgi:RNA polymerase sigma-70 factor (sigma-E family)